MSEATKPNRTPAQPGAETFAQKLAPFRNDILCAFTLVVLTTLIWCTIYNRWTAEDWRTPIFYPHLVFHEDQIDATMDMARADVMQQFAIIKAASEDTSSP